MQTSVEEGINGIFEEILTLAQVAEDNVDVGEGEDSGFELFSNIILEVPSCPLLNKSICSATWYEDRSGTILSRDDTAQIEDWV